MTIFIREKLAKSQFLNEFGYKNIQGLFGETRLCFIEQPSVKIDHFPIPDADTLKKLSPTSLDKARILEDRKGPLKDAVKTIERTENKNVYEEIAKQLGVFPSKLILSIIGAIHYQLDPNLEFKPNPAQWITDRVNDINSIALPNNPIKRNPNNIEEALICDYSLLFSTDHFDGTNQTLTPTPTGLGIAPILIACMGPESGYNLEKTIEQKTLEEDATLLIEVVEKIQMNDHLFFEKETFKLSSNSEITVNLLKLILRNKRYQTQLASAGAYINLKSSANYEWKEITAASPTQLITDLFDPMGALTVGSFVDKYCIKNEKFKDVLKAELGAELGGVTTATVTNAKVKDAFNTVIAKKQAKVLYEDKLKGLPPKYNPLAPALGTIPITVTPVVTPSTSPDPIVEVNVLLFDQTSKAYKYEKDLIENLNDDMTKEEIKNKAKQNFLDILDCIPNISLDDYGNIKDADPGNPAHKKVQFYINQFKLHNIVLSNVAPIQSLKESIQSRSKLAEFSEGSLKIAPIFKNKTKNGEELTYETIKKDLQETKEDYDKVTTQAELKKYQENKAEINKLDKEVAENYLFNTESIMTGDYGAIHIKITKKRDGIRDLLRKLGHRGLTLIPAPVTETDKAINVLIEKHKKLTDMLNARIAANTASVFLNKYNYDLHYEIDINALYLRKNAIDKTSASIIKPIEKFLTEIKTRKYEKKESFKEDVLDTCYDGAKAVFEKDLINKGTSSSSTLGTDIDEVADTIWKHNSKFIDKKLKGSEFEGIGKPGIRKIIENMQNKMRATYDECEALTKYCDLSTENKELVNPTKTAELIKQQKLGTIYDVTRMENLQRFQAIQNDPKALKAYETIMNAKTEHEKKQIVIAITSQTKEVNIHEDNSSQIALDNAAKKYQKSMDKGGLNEWWGGLTGGMKATIIGLLTIGALNNTKLATTLGLGALGAMALTGAKNPVEAADKILTWGENQFNKAAAWAGLSDMSRWNNIDKRWKPTEPENSAITAIERLKAEAIIDSIIGDSPQDQKSLSLNDRLMKNSVSIESEINKLQTGQSVIPSRILSQDEGGTMRNTFYKLGLSEEDLSKALYKILMIRAQRGDKQGAKSTAFEGFKLMTEDATKYRASDKNARSTISFSEWIFTDVSKYDGWTKEKMTIEWLKQVGINQSKAVIEYIKKYGGEVVEFTKGIAIKGTKFLLDELKVKNPDGTFTFFWQNVPWDELKKNDAGLLSYATELFNSAKNAKIGIQLNDGFNFIARSAEEIKNYLGIMQPDFYEPVDTGRELLPKEITAYKDIVNHLSAKHEDLDEDIYGWLHFDAFGLNVNVINSITFGLLDNTMPSQDYQAKNVTAKRALEKIISGGEIEGGDNKNRFSALSIFLVQNILIKAKEDLGKSYPKTPTQIEDMKQKIINEINALYDKTNPPALIDKLFNFISGKPIQPVDLEKILLIGLDKNQGDVAKTFWENMHTKLENKEIPDPFGRDHVYANEMLYMRLLSVYMEGYKLGVFTSEQVVWDAFATPGVNSSFPEVIKYLREKIEKTFNPEIKTTADLATQDFSKINHKSIINFFKKNAELDEKIKDKFITFIPLAPTVPTAPTAPNEWIVIADKINKSGGASLIREFVMLLPDNDTDAMTVLTNLNLTAPNSPLIKAIQDRIDFKPVTNVNELLSKKFNSDDINIINTITAFLENPQTKIETTPPLLAQWRQVAQNINNSTSPHNLILVDAFIKKLILDFGSNARTTLNRTLGITSGIVYENMAKAEGTREITNLNDLLNSKDFNSNNPDEINKIVAYLKTTTEKIDLNASTLRFWLRVISNIETSTSKEKDRLIKAFVEKLTADIPTFNTGNWTSVPPAGLWQTIPGAVYNELNKVLNEKQRQVTRENLNKNIPNFATNVLGLNPNNLHDKNIIKYNQSNFEVEMIAPNEMKIEYKGISIVVEGTNLTDRKIQVLGNATIPKFITPSYTQKYTPFTILHKLENFETMDSSEIPPKNILEDYFQEILQGENSNFIGALPNMLGYWRGGGVINTMNIPLMEFIGRFEKIKEFYEKNEQTLQELVHRIRAYYDVSHSAENDFAAFYLKGDDIMFAEAWGTNDSVIHEIDKNQFKNIQWELPENIDQNNLLKVITLALTQAWIKTP